MPLVSEFNREEFARRYAGTFIGTGFDGPIYITHVHRARSEGMLVEYIKAKDYLRSDHRHEVHLTDDNCNLLLPDLGYVTEDGVTGYVSRNISRSYKRGLDLGTISYKNPDQTYNTITGTTIIGLYNVEYPALEDVLKGSSKRFDKALPLNKEWALYRSKYFKIPVVLYHNSEVGLFDTDKGELLIKQELDWLPEVFPNQFNGLGVVLK